MGLVCIRSRGPPGGPRRPREGPRIAQEHPPGASRGPGARVKKLSNKTSFPPLPPRRLRPWAVSAGRLRPWAVCRWAEEERRTSLVRRSSRAPDLALHRVRGARSCPVPLVPPVPQSRPVPPVPQVTPGETKGFSAIRRGATVSPGAPLCNVNPYSQPVPFVQGRS